MALKRCLPEKPGKFVISFTPNVNVLGYGKVTIENLQTGKIVEQDVAHYDAFIKEIDKYLIYALYE